MDLCKQNISEKELPSKISTMETTNAKGEVGKNYLWLKLVYFQRNINVLFFFLKKGPDTIPYSQLTLHNLKLQMKHLFKRLLKPS